MEDFDDNVDFLVPPPPLPTPPRIATPAKQEGTTRSPSFLDTPIAFMYGLFGRTPSYEEAVAVETAETEALAASSSHQVTPSSSATTLYSRYGSPIAPPQFEEQQASSSNAGPPLSREEAEDLRNQALVQSQLDVLEVQDPLRHTVLTNLMKEDRRSAEMVNFMVLKVADLRLQRYWHDLPLSQVYNEAKELWWQSKVKKADRISRRWYDLLPPNLKASRKDTKANIKGLLSQKTTPQKKGR